MKPKTRRERQQVHHARPDRMRPGHCWSPSPRHRFASFAFGPSPSPRAGHTAAGTVRRSVFPSLVRSVADKGSVGLMHVNSSVKLSSNFETVLHRRPHRHWSLLQPVRRLPSSNISSVSLLKGAGVEFSLVAVIGVLVGRRIRSVNLLRYLVISLLLKLIRVQTLIAASSSTNCFLSGNFTLVEDGGKQVPVRIWQTPGDGSCLFHSIAAALILDDLHSASIDDAIILKRLQNEAQRKRSSAVDVLSGGDRNLRLSRDERITSARLVEMASKQYGISPSRYLKEMKEDCVWGGGPEIVAVANHLGRQIVLLEEYEESTSGTRIELKVMARFGIGRPPIHILSTNQKFPKERFKRKNHFVAVFV